jgi:polar amino acid transport system ATP-binding protein
MTMLLVTHEMGFARQAANRIIFMHEGQVCEQGPPAQMLDDPQTAPMRQFVQSIRNRG